MNIHDYLSVTPEVQQALRENKPVVALESTILIRRILNSAVRSSASSARRALSPRPSPFWTAR